MKLASLKSGRDGALVVVSRDLTRCVSAGHIAPTLQHALDHWHEAAPANLWDKGQGQPHLTWIFVRQYSQGAGIGTQLLQKAVRVLKKQGYKTLWTTFQQGNDSSALWHWRNGFELFPNLMSKRRRRRELKLPI